MASKDSMVKELDKLTKSKLIEIILTRKIPSDVNVGEHVRKIVENVDNAIFSNENSDSMDVDGDITSKLRSTKGELKYALLEIECLKRVNAEQERSIQNQQITISAQESLIDMLKRNNGLNSLNYNVAGLSSLSQNASNSSKESENYPKYTKVTTKTSDPGVTTQKKLDSQQQPGRITPLQVQQGIKNAQRAVTSGFIQSHIDPSISNNNEWQDVRPKKRKPRILVGKKEDTEVSIRAVPKLVDLHVYRLHPDTTSVQITNHLKPIFPEVKSEKLDSKNANIYASFKVTILQENFSKAMDATVWPVNTCVRRFLYHRNKTQEASD